MRHTAAVRALAVVGLGLGVTACGSNGTTEGESAAAVETVVETTTADPTTTAPTTAAPTTAVGADDAEMTDESMDDMDDMDSDEMDDAEHDDKDDAEHDAMDASAAWPRPWDPTQPIDFSGVPDVTPEQQAYAEELAAETLEVLPAKFADPSTLKGLGYFSIGDAPTGYEHYINGAYLVDDHVLDPNYPESVVYEVDGNERTLSAAMFMVGDTAVDDPELEEIGGPLMQWHIHNDLCWQITQEGPQVVGVHGPGEPCPDGQISSGPAGERVPMVHVWVLPNQCGPFAALEGIGAGQVDPDAEVRLDQCHTEH